MRFFSSRCRTAAEILLTVAVLGYVTYDLVDLGGSSKPSASSSTSVLASAAVEAQPLSSSSPAAPTRPHPAASFQPQMDPTILPNNTFYVCNSLAAPTNPWIIGGLLANQSLVFQAGNPATCTQAPAVLPPNNTAGCAAVAVTSGSWLSLQNVVTPALPGCVGLLTMDAGSNLEAVVPATFSANPYVVQSFPLLVSRGACPSLALANNNVVNCPVDTTLTLTGPYTCVLTATYNNDTCVIGLTISGALASQATTYIQATMNRDCSAMTQTTFKQQINTVVGVSPAALLITYWQCSSIVVIFTVLGANPTQATAVLNLIYASMLNGQLRILLAITAVTLNPAPFPTRVTVTSTYAKPYYPMIPYPILVSSSNPALFALLSLLLIPIAVAIALLVWWCYRNRVVPPPEPVCIPQCCPAPMPMPMCCPPPAPVCCETTTLCEPLCTPSCTPFAAPAMYQPTC